MIYLIADTHGDIELNKLSIKNFPESKKLTKNDYIIILGDFGLLWKNEPDKTEHHWISFLNRCPFTTLFMAGNHENYYRLNNLPEKEMFGSTVGIVSDSILMLKTGHYYTIGKHTFWVFGGAASVDKANRTPYVSWWPEEIPSYRQMAFGMDTLEAHGNVVDYILTHTAPTSLVDAYIASIHSSRFMDADPVEKYLEVIKEHTQYKQWFCGHWHEDAEFGKHVFVYNKFYKIGE